MADFEIAFGETEAQEGGYANDPVDRGGETYRGVARNIHPDWLGWKRVDLHKAAKPKDLGTVLDGDQKLFDLVKSFYKTKYWDTIRGDDLPNQHIANEVYDTGVNQGIGRSIRYLQEALNLLNRNQKSYPDIKVDGAIGKNTLATLNVYLKSEKDQPDYLLKVLNLMQGNFYLDIMRNKPEQQRFARGWLNRVNLR